MNETATVDPAVSESPDLSLGREHPARGKVIETRDGRIVFQPKGTNYELHLEVPEGYGGPMNKPVAGIIRINARKVYTVKSGGNFVAPILGTPRTIQGRVLTLNERQLVLHAGTPILVELPTAKHAIDLAAGPIEQGQMVNVVVLPGASFIHLPSL